MAREKLTNRRVSVTHRVKMDMDGKEVVLLITVGYDTSSYPPLPREVFCANFKVGTSLNAIVMDSCILLSLLLQHGEDPKSIADRLTPGSLLETLCNGVLRDAVSPT
jgi:hypothetical protein